MALLLLLLLLAVASVEVETALLEVLDILELLVFAATRPTYSAASPIKPTEKHFEEALNELLVSETPAIHWDSNCDALSAVIRCEKLCSAILAVKKKLFFFSQKALQKVIL